MKNYAVLNSLKRINSYNKTEAQYVIPINTTSLIRLLKCNTLRPLQPSCQDTYTGLSDVQISSQMHPDFLIVHQGLSLSTHYYMPDMPTMQKIITKETLVASA
jgi:hypothetical protein